MFSSSRSVIVGSKSPLLQQKQLFLIDTSTYSLQFIISTTSSCQLFLINTSSAEAVIFQANLVSIFAHYSVVIMSAIASQNHRRVDCLHNRLFKLRSKKTPKLRVTGLCEVNSQATGEFPHKGPVTRKRFFHLMTSSCTDTTVPCASLCHPEQW